MFFIAGSFESTLKDASRHLTKTVMLKSCQLKIRFRAAKHMRHLSKRTRLHAATLIKIMLFLVIGFCSLPVK